ncbi:hypothetical protein EDB92DRAFT_1765783, partial [Lactarius akahatsu]
MVLGRLAHYAFDAILLSTVAAGVKRTTGFAPDIESISNPTMRSFTQSYLGFGETVFDAIQGNGSNQSLFQ